jgi:AI-2 transport protein TqsA
MSINTPPPISPGLRFLLSAACLVIVVAGLRGAKSILVPLALALFIAVVSLPLLHLVRRKGVPTSVAILLVVLFDASAIFLFGWLVSLAAIEIQAELPIYLQRLQEMEEVAVAWLAERGFEMGEVATLWFPEQTDGTSVWPSVELSRLYDLATYLVEKATDLLTMAFLVTLIFIFMLAEASTFPRKIRSIVGRNSDALGRAAKVVKEIQHYLAIKTLISAATGFTIGVATWGLGLDFPLLWGLLAFILNYIPNVGSIIAAVPAVVVGLLQIGPGAAVLVAVVFAGVNALFGNFIEPMLVGRQLGISTLVVILSLVFWGWLWGPVGMFLSVPLTMGLKIGLENSDEFRWVATLMTAEGKGTAAPAATGAPALPSGPPPPPQQSGVS